MTGQLKLFSGGSVAVLEPVGTNESNNLHGSDDSGWNRFRNHPPKSSMIQGGTTPSLTERESPEPVPADQTLLQGERSSANASLLPCGQRGRAEEPTVALATPVSESGTGPEPWRLADGLHGSEQPTFRPYQSDGLVAIDAQFAAGCISTLLVLPTGTGKTVVFAEWIRRIVASGGRVLGVAHRTELLEQMARKLSDVGVRSSLDKGASKASLSAHVVVGSVQTLRGARLERYPEDHFDAIVFDEAHHAAATSYVNVRKRFPKALLLGVTATPDRGDGKALGKIFETVAFTYEMRQAIRDGFLVPLRAKRVLVANLDLTAIKSHHGDFDQSELAVIMADEKAVHGVVGPLLKLAGDRKTLVFGVDVAHAMKLAEIINRHKSGAAVAIDGTASDAERRAVLNLFRDGKIQFLVNCALYTEGFDEPSIQCVAMVRPTQSRGLYTQMLGRVTRLFGATYAESIANGKRDGLVLDFVGNSKHRLAGPVDALAGAMVDEDVRDVAEAALDGQTSLEDVLVHVEDELAARRTKVSLIALSEYRTKEIDPFLGDVMPPLDPNSPAARRPATDKQLSALESAGLGKPPPGLTLGEASLMLDAIAERRRRGLATIPQRRLLEKMNLDTKTMTFERAQQLIIKGRARGMKPWFFAHEAEFRRSARKS